MRFELILNAYPDIAWAFIAINLSYEGRLLNYTLRYN